MILNLNRESEEETMKRAASVRLVIAVMAFCLPLISNSAAAQEEKSKESASTEQKPLAVYRIEFNVREIEDGKRLNSRNYMMVVDEGNRGMIRVGNRVPFQTSEKQYQYHDVGMNIDCRPRDREGGIELVINVEVSSVVPPGQLEAAPTFNPVFRTQSTGVTPIVAPGKPTLVASMDDVVTNRRYEIEVTVTKVK
jgi:hypothetical protein